MGKSIGDIQQSTYSEEHDVIKVATSEHVSTFTAEYTADGSGNLSETLITPTSGYHVEVYGVYVSTDGAAGTVSLDFATSTIKLYNSYLAKETAPSPIGLHIEGAADEVLTLTTTGIGASKKVFVLVNYAQHNG